MEISFSWTVQTFEFQKIFSLLGQLINLLQNIIVPWAPPPPIINMNHTTIFHNITFGYNKVISKVQQPWHWKLVFFGFIGRNVQLSTKNLQRALRGGEIGFSSLTLHELVSCWVALLDTSRSWPALKLIFLKGSLKSKGLEITLMLGEKV
jgi:hypothetical protein